VHGIAVQCIGAGFYASRLLTYGTFKSRILQTSIVLVQGNAWVQCLVLLKCRGEILDSILRRLDGKLLRNASRTLHAKK